MSREITCSCVLVYLPTLVRAALENIFILSRLSRLPLAIKIEHSFHFYIHIYIEILLNPLINDYPEILKKKEMSVSQLINRHIRFKDDPYKCLEM